VQQRNTNNARHLNEEQLQPQQALDPTTRTEKNNRETTEGNTGVMTNGASWDPYLILGVEALSKWYYAALPGVRLVEDLVRYVNSVLGPQYLARIGFGGNSLTKLLRGVRR
jgi:hypothetical protein